MECLSSVDAIVDPHHPLYLLLAEGCLALPRSGDIEKCEYVDSVSMSPFVSRLVEHLACKGSPIQASSPSRFMTNPFLLVAPVPKQNINECSCLHYPTYQSPCDVPLTKQKLQSKDKQLNRLEC